MTVVELQKAIGVKADGIWGGQSQNALLKKFTSADRGSLDAATTLEFAKRLGVSARQLAAVAKVEAAGSGFDADGRPKILFERHKFHQFTKGEYSNSAFSNPVAGGYGESSWAKLQSAIATGAVDAAFMSCSWGKFQVMGQYWQEFGYASPYALAESTAMSEKGHYQLLVRYIETNRLQPSMKNISIDPATCRAFARAYNGSNYEKFDYHNKLAAAMK